VAVTLGIALTLRAEVAAQADGPTQASQRELQIERSLACPQCTALPLDICDRDICVDMRAVLRDRIAAGESDQAIRQYFVERYGARVLLEPPRNRDNLLIWIAPGLALVAGALGLYIFLSFARHGRAGRLSEPSADPALVDYRSRVERELELYE